MLYASMLNITIQNVRMEITGDWRIEGSVFRQTRASVMERVETKLDVESDADPKLIAAVLRNASNGCHAEMAIKKPTPVEETVTVNGEAFDFEDYPVETVRRQPDADPS